MEVQQLLIDIFKGLGFSMTQIEVIAKYTIGGVNVGNLIIFVFIMGVTHLLRKSITKAIIGVIKFLFKDQINHKLLETLELGMGFIIALIGLSILTEALELGRFEDYLHRILKPMIIFSLYLFAFHSVDKFSYKIRSFTKRFGKKMSKDLEIFFVRLIKIIIFIMGLVSMLKEFDIDITHFLASLGLVGMAFALAAKDTAANLFGSLVIFIDKPFEIGNWIKTPHGEGVVEDIGMRSTRIRTFAQAMVSIPNAVMANTQITNWSKMGKRRIKMRLGLTYSTTPQQMRAILADIENMLKTHDDIHKQMIMIRFDRFDDSALSILCYFFTKTTVWSDHLAVHQDVNLKLMEIVTKNGSSFAFPSSSLYIEKNDDQEDYM